MKYLRQFCAVALLTVVFSVTAFGGDLPYPGHTSPQPKQPTTEEGDLPFTGATAVDPVAEVALNLLQGVLALL